MAAIAIIVGIDEYSGDLPPLTSAVNDAIAWRNTLFSLGLVASPAEVRLLTSPVIDGSQPATHKNITRELLALYRRGAAYERMYFVFSGHGLNAYIDASHATTTSVIVPVDVTNLDDDGRNLIDVEELRRYFELVGPKEQFYFIDACRDLDYKHYPKVGTLGWGGGVGTGTTLGAARAQDTVWAVAPLYTATGVRGGNGVMTGHVLEGLASDRVAVVYDATLGEYVITAESLREYAEHRIRASVETEAAWKLKYMLPQPEHRGPLASPLRVLRNVRDVPFTLHIDPDAAGAATDVRLAISGHPLHTFPPYKNHQTIPLAPQPHLLTATSRAGNAAPSRHVVDARRVDAATVRVTPFDGDAGPPPPPTSPGPSQSIVHAESPPLVIEKGFLGPAGPSGTVSADALEPQATIELIGVTPPYERHVAQRSLRADVTPGPYEITFRLGRDAFSQALIFVADGESIRVQPTVEVSPLLMELTGASDPAPGDVVVSETIGPMQAAVLPTILPILGIKPFDQRRELFGQFDDAFEGRYRSADEFKGRPLSIVVALDGDWRERPVGEVLRSIECGVRARRNSWEPLKLEPLPTADLHARNRRPSDRVATQIALPQAASFQLSIRAPEFVSVVLSCASIDRRATVVTLRLGEDGSVDITQNLLRIPGWDYGNEKVPNVPYGRLLRQLLLGQKLFQSGQLLQAIDDAVPYDETKTAWLELLYAKWSDPILSCMAYHAWRAAVNDPRPGEWLLPETARNLRKYFGELPDAQVVYATQFEAERDSVMQTLIDADVVPVLAVNARLLAEFAEKHDRRDSRVARMVRQIAPNQVWTARLG